MPSNDSFFADQERIDSARRAAEKYQNKLSSEDYDFIRWKAKNDLLFLARGPLGYRKLSPNLHGNLCTWLFNTRYDQFRLILLPRSHYKTTLETIADSIRIALPDVDGKGVYPNSLGPNVRILLAHESQGPPGGASRFLHEITRHFCDNPKLIALFPECVPDPKQQRMNVHELELPRSEFWSEPTFDTIGVGGRAQGRHYDFIKLDDIFGDKARDSIAECKTTKQWFDNIQAFFVELPHSKMDIIGTRYSLDDVYSHAIEVYGDVLVKYIRRVEETDINGDLSPIFPEQFTTESLAIIRKSPVVWASQYCNDPVAGLAQFDRSWKRFYEWIGENRLVVFSGHRQTAVHVRDCDVSILIDPARSGKTGIVVTAVDSQNRVFVVDAIKDRFRDPDLINLIFRLVQRWMPRVVAIEDVLFSGLYQPWIESEMKLRNVRFNVQGMKRKRAGRSPESKDEHIRALANYFSSGLIFFHESQTLLQEEYDHFGATEDVHMLDAMAYGPQVWRPGMSAEQWKKFRDAERSMLDDRDLATGYSRI